MAERDAQQEFEEALTPTEEAPEPAPSSRVSGWGRVLRGNKPVWIVAGAAVLSLVAGLVLGRFVISPADAAANSAAPPAGLITVPVELGELSNDVTIRADVGYADAVDVSVGEGVVTGRVPEVGAELGGLAVALEIAGRPVIVLPGELPAYRDLQVGATGPDVLQLRQALEAVGIPAGDAASDTFDSALANAVGRLYTEVGYDAPSEEDADEFVRAAEQGVLAADQGVASAQRELDAARSGTDAVAVREADNAVSSARRELDAARGSGADALEVANLQDALGLAELRRSQLDRPADTGAQQDALAAARSARTQAAEELARAREGALASLPQAEVLFLTELPRRVDAVNVERGATATGAALTVSGADVRLTGAAAEADARLLKVGARAVFELADGTEHAATVSAVEAPSGESSRWSVLLEPDPLEPEQIQQLQGSNVRVVVPVGATEGEVLSVPLAALTAGPGGDSRVEVVEGDPRDGERADTRLVTVETGLAAAGYVEVTPVDGDLGEGELVVVGE